MDEHGEPRADGGFDAVIGNPPYIRVQELGRDVADYARSRFSCASGSFDAYVVFLERGIGLLAPHGRLGFIVPNKLFKLDFGARLRELLAGRELVDEVLDFGSSQLFAGATNYTCILILDGGGTAELQYRRLAGSRERVLEELASAGAIPAQRFATKPLGREPWVLVPPEEAAVTAAAVQGAERLADVTEDIFTGLQTSADDVYVLDDRGTRGGLRVVWSRAARRELELEPDLLHPLASGGDVGRYAFRPLRSLLLFPYVREGREMRLMNESELDQLPLTKGYLEQHEQTLRGREREKMDRAGWYGYVYPKSLGAHNSPKLGVPRLCERLRAAWDEDGSVYLDNVDVNGILLGEAMPSSLIVTLNSRLLDWIFRRMSVPFQNDFWSANKQFISGLPIRTPEGDEAGRFDALGRRLHELSAAAAAERAGYLEWMATTLGVERRRLPSQRRLDRYELLTGNELLAVLARGRARLSTDPRERNISELLRREHAATSARLAPLLADLAQAEVEADERVFELYRIPAAMRRLVESEYE